VCPDEFAPLSRPLLGSAALRRDVDAAAAQLVKREEDRMRRTPGYRSSRRTLQKLAHSYLLYECADAEHGAWDRFHVRNLGLKCAAGDRAALAAVAQAKNFGDRLPAGDLERLRAAIIQLGSEPKQI